MIAECKTKTQILVEFVLNKFVYYFLYQFLLLLLHVCFS